MIKKVWVSNNGQYDSVRLQVEGSSLVMRRDCDNDEIFDLSKEDAIELRDFICETISHLD